MYFVVSLSLWRCFVLGSYLTFVNCYVDYRWFFTAIIYAHEFRNKQHY
jgi:hypothetical protein